MLAAINHLNIAFPTPDGGMNPVVKDVSLQIEEGEVLALVGESGSGKSLTALSLMQLLPESAQVSGEITFAGERIDQKTDQQMRSIRGSRIAMIFQEPMTALNPLHTIGKQINEILELHNPLMRKQERLEKIKELLSEVGLEKLHNRLSAYPHQLSGGERQRVMIAMAIACEPELLLADEPTTAVDVTLQQQILKLLKALQKSRGLSILFITHDLQVVEQIADRVVVLKQGELVEVGEVKAFFKKPKTEYARKLLNSRPKGKAPTPSVQSSETLLNAEQLIVKFPESKNFFGKVTEWNRAVKQVSLSLKKGYSLGIVGESGSGKTTLAMALLKLQPAQGRIVFQGNDILHASQAELKSLRKDLQIVFQDPFGSLNPRMTIGQIIGEGLKVHFTELSLQQRNERVSALLEEVGLSKEMMHRYPHEFSGGQRQRIAIARALILEPSLIVMDEPTSALDVTMQAQIIELLHEIQQRRGVSLLFISHDLAVVRTVCHEVMVMRQGELVECGPTEEVYENPQQDYTKALIQASLGEWAA